MYFEKNVAQLDFEDGLNGGRQMIRNPDTSEGQPHTIFTAPPVQYDNSQFVPVPVKKGEDFLKQLIHIGDILFYTFM